jgi:hypothetical protein
MAFPVRVEIKLNRTAALQAHAMLGMWENKRGVYAWHARGMWIGLIFRLESTCVIQWLLQLDCIICCACARSVVKRTSYTYGP